MDEIDELIDWSAVVKLLDRIYGNDEGRPSYPLLTYVNRLLLQQWYGLSDPGLEEAVNDRLSFRRFAGLPLDENVPDHSTLWRFRQEWRLSPRPLHRAAPQRLPSPPVVHRHQSYQPVDDVLVVITSAWR